MPNAQFCTLGPFFSSGALVTTPKLYHYSAGTLTLKNIWEERSESTTLAQPFVGDANGVLNFFADGLYKLVVKDASDNTLYTWDNVLIKDLSAPSLAEGSSIASAQTTVLGDEVFAHITGTTSIEGFSGTIPFFWAVFDGSLTLVHSSSLLLPGSVNCTVQSGDVGFFVNEGSDVWRLAGQMPNSLLINRTDVSVVVSDARTNSVDAPLTVTSTTSGTPAAGIGTGVLLRAESQDENPSDVGQVECAFSDVGTGTEDSYFQILLRVSGAALTACYRFVATGAFKAILTHANSADRTYTLPNYDGTLATLAGTESLSNKTLSGAVVSGAAPSTPTANVLYADSFVKGWVKFAPDGSIAGDVNVSSITDSGAGDWTVNWATAFSSENYAVCVSCLGQASIAGGGASTDSGERLEIDGQAAGSVGICHASYTVSGRSLVDPINGTYIYAIAVGAQ